MPRPRVPLCVLAPLCFLAPRPVCGQLLPFSVRDSPGIDVSPPRLVAENLTWQFDVLLFATATAHLVPLFVDRLAPPGPPLEPCEGVVPVCCLETLAANFVNARFALYVGGLGVHGDETGACPLAAGLSARSVLAGWPAVDELQTGAFATPAPRAWCVEAHRCTFEIAAALLRDARFTEDLGVSSELNGVTVTDRRLEVVVAIVSPTTTPLTQLTLSRHMLLFHDPDTPPPPDPNFRHHAFSHVCRDVEKPEFALWRADVFSREELCLWFCEPGFVLYPATTDAGLLAARRPYSCEPEAARRTVLSVGVAVRLWAAPEVPDDEYHAETITALQAALEAVFALPVGASILHVQDATENGTLIVSMALFFDECPRNHSAFEERVAMTLVDAATVARATDELRDSLGWAAVNTSEVVNASGPGVDSFWVFEMETVVRCPSRVPLLLLVTAAAWAGLLCVFGLYGARAAVRRVRERRARILRSLGPVAQPAFRARI
jgi:hypothetical protein